MVWHKDFQPEKQVRVEIWIDKTSQWVKVLAAKPDDLSSIPGTHTVEENQLLQEGKGMSKNRVCKYEDAMLRPIIFTLT